MPEKKAAKKREAKRTFESQVDAPFSMQLVPQQKPGDGTDQLGDSDASTLTVEAPEPKVLSRLIHRIKGL